MRHILVVLAFVVAGAAVPAGWQAAAEDALVGTWTGPYDGSGVGKYSMSITRDDTKQLVGTLEVSPSEGGGFSVAFKSIVVTGSAAVLKYDDPGGGSEVQIDVTLDGKSLKGTWKATETGSNTVVSEGTLTGTKS